MGRAAALGRYRVGAPLPFAPHRKLDNSNEPDESVVWSSLLASRIATGAYIVVQMILAFGRQGTMSTDRRLLVAVTALITLLAAFLVPTVASGSSHRAAGGSRAPSTSDAKRRICGLDD